MQAAASASRGVGAAGRRWGAESGEGPAAGREDVRSSFRLAEPSPSAPRFPALTLPQVSIVSTQTFRRGWSWIVSTQTLRPGRISIVSTQTFDCVFTNTRDRCRAGRAAPWQPRPSQRPGRVSRPNGCDCRRCLETYGDLRHSAASKGKMT